jgi:hypothetical protein
MCPKAVSIGGLHSENISQSSEYTMFQKLKRRTFLLAGLLTSVWGATSPAASDPQFTPPLAAAKSIPDRLRAVREHLKSVGSNTLDAKSNASRFAQWYNFPNGFRNFPNAR